MEREGLLRSFYTEGVVFLRTLTFTCFFFFGLVNGGNSGPGGLTQLGQGPGDWVRGASDHPGLYSLLTHSLTHSLTLCLSWVYLHVRPDRFMTMDYFLLLCSLLLPVVSAVEGKIFFFSPVFARCCVLRCRMP